MRLLKGIFTSIGPRILSAGATILVTKAAQYGLTLDPTELIGFSLGVYAALHKAISSKINPGDGAKLRVNEAIKSASDTPFIDTVKIAPSE